MTRDQRRRRILAAVLVAAGVGVAFVPLPQTRIDRSGTTTVRVQDAILNSIGLEENGTVIAASGPDPFIILPSAPKPITAIRLDLSALGPLGNDFQVYFIPERKPGPFSDAFVQPGRSMTIPEGWRVEWHLPEPAIGYRIDIPEGARFRVVSLETSERPEALTTTSRGAGATLQLALSLTLLILGVQLAWRPFVPPLAAVKRASIAALMCPLAVMIFLLPPFQGPDERNHWLLALAYYRPSIASEPAAYRLPDTLGAKDIAFNPTVKFDPARLASLDPGPPVPASELAAETRELQARYPYARVYAYPAVFFLSALFPPMKGVDEALVFFYLCRLLPGVALILILLAADRAYDIPFTAVFFFSLPLVLQQFVTVSVDVFLNLGTAGAVLLYLAARDRPTRALKITLWVLTLLIVAVKFILAGLIVLPLALTWPRRRTGLILAGCAVALAALAYPAALAVWREVRGYADLVGRAAEADRQLAFVSSGAGMAQVAELYARYAATLFDVSLWSGPLGWLDTPLGDAHVKLIWMSGAAALLLDGWRYAPALLAAVANRGRQLALWTAAVVAGLVFVTFVDVLLYYFMTSPPGAPYVVGVQVRHFFPIAIVAVLLPVGLRRFAALRDGGVVWRTTAAVTLAVTLAARTTLLAFDLLVRYW